jgi:hypothetical protein
MLEKAQSFQNHARFDPPFHFFIFPVMAINAIVAIVVAFRNPGGMTIWGAVAAVALAGAVLKMRIYALRNQDRVIRLEERLRMQSLLPEALRARVGELTVQQCVGLRFACDAELPTLVERALRENLDKKQIKQAVQTWRADYNRI